jgi:hypothetical protein
MSDSDHLRASTLASIEWARDNALFRDLAIINRRTHNELGPPTLTTPSKEARRKPNLPNQRYNDIVPYEQLPQEADDVNLKHLVAVATVAASSLVACQQGTASADNAVSRKSGSEQVAPASSRDMLAQENAAHPATAATSPAIKQLTPAPTNDMQAVAIVFASDKSRDWDAYAKLSQVKWNDPTLQERTAGHYGRSGTILLQGFTVKDIPNGKPGLDYATVKRNEGESTLNVTGTLSGVESVSISKPLYSDNYLNILKNQFGRTAEVVTIAEQCPAPEYEEGAGNGAFFEVSLAGGAKIYVQASQKDGGKYTDGFTVFDLSRTRPSEVITELNCKPAN